MAQFHIPRGWSEINIAQLREFNDLSQRTDLDATDRAIQLIALVQPDPSAAVDALELLPYNELIRLYGRLGWMADYPPSKIHSRRVLLGGRTYRLVSNPAAIPAHLFATCQTLAEGGQIIENLHKIIAALMIPQRRRWFGWVDEVQDKDETARLWEERSKLCLTELPVSIAYPYALFFSASLPKLLAASQTYFQRMERKAKKAATRADG